MKRVTTELLEELFADVVEDEAADETELPEFEALYRPGLSKILTAEGHLDLRDDNSTKVRNYFEQYRGENVGYEDRAADPAQLLDEIYDTRGNKETTLHYGPHYVIVPRGSSKISDKARMRCLFEGVNEAITNETFWLDWHTRCFRNVSRQRAYVDVAYASSNTSEVFERTMLFDEALQDVMFPILGRYHSLLDDWRNSFTDRDPSAIINASPTAIAESMMKKLKKRAPSKYMGEHYRTWEPTLLEEFDPKNPNYDGETLNTTIREEAEVLARMFGNSYEECKRFALVVLIDSRRKQFYMADTLEMHRAARKKDVSGKVIPNRYLTLHNRTPDQGAFNR